MAQLTIQQAFETALGYHKAGQLQQAERLYRAVLARQPQHAEALHYLGLIAAQVGRRDLAVDLIRQALAIKPYYAEAYANLGSTLKMMGHLDQAIAACRQAIVLQPTFAAGHCTLGDVLKDQGSFDEAVAAYRQAVALKPDYPDAFNNLGNALNDQGRRDEAITAYRRAIALKPDYPKAWFNLGVALQSDQQPDDAIFAYRSAIALNPNYAKAYSNLGSALKAKGALDEAIAAYRRAIEIKPDYFAAHGSLVYTLHFHPGYDARAIAEEHRRWNQKHAAPLGRSIQPHANDRNAERRIRIGYVSPDFREHPVGRFLLPLFASHDKKLFEIIEYAQVPDPDAMTQRLQSHANLWRNINGMADAQVADLIRNDQIDILVDLTMHMSDNRMLVFARKPAPVQVTYLAYCSTTGLRAIDYRLSDPYLDPAGADESNYSEQTVRLPETYWCYQPREPSPEISPLPARDRGYITFGCLNNFCKVGESTLAAWGRILRAVPASRLLIHAHEGSHRQRVRDRLGREGVEPDRVQFVGFVPPGEYFNLYRQIDIALDTFPYGGGTTTCDALWMGVPVVSLAGKTAVGRGGLSILSNTGLPELVAASEDEYVHLASALAGDLSRLSNLRATLRQRMEQSPLMNALRFARNVETSYRRMWRKWCAEAASP